MSAASAASVSPPAVVWSHVWRWRAQLPERKGTLCRIVAWAESGKRVMVEFPDGLRVFVARSAIRAQRENPLTLFRARVGG